MGKTGLLFYNGENFMFDRPNRHPLISIAIVLIGVLVCLTATLILIPTSWFFISSSRGLLASFPYIAAFLVAFVAIVLGNGVWHFIWKPRIVVESLHDTDIEHTPSGLIGTFHSSRASLGSSDNSIVETYTVLTYELRVSNIGLSIARNTRAYLTLNDERFKGQKFQLKWKSIAEPTEYVQDKTGRREIVVSLDKLSSPNQSIDLLPGRDSYELLGIAVERDIDWLEESYGNIEAYPSKVRMIFSPQYYYSNLFQRILLSRVLSRAKKNKSLDELASESGYSDITGRLRIVYETGFVNYNINFSDWSLSRGNRMKISLQEE